MFMLGGCIENDVPYPVVKLSVLNVEAEGTKSAPVIDAASHSIHMELEETTDIRKVNITKFEVSEGAKCSVAFPGTFDLRTPLYFTLSMYQEWEWTLTASQEIERYFRVDGQIGESVIDAEHFIATAYVPMDTDMKAITITDIKLGPKDITTYSVDPFTFTDFEESVRLVDV